MRYTLCLSSKVSKSWTMFGCFNLEVDQNKLWVICWNTVSKVALEGKTANNGHICNRPKLFFLCFVDRTFRYHRVKKNQLDAQLILSIFRQLLHVSGASRPIINNIQQMVLILFRWLSVVLVGYGCTSWWWS